MSRKIDRITDLATEHSADTEDAIRVFNAATGRDHTALDVAEYGAGRDVDEFAKEAARPACSRIPDMADGNNPGRIRERRAAAAVLREPQQPGI